MVLIRDIVVVYILQVLSLGRVNSSEICTMYEEGLGVAKDNEKAVYWYGKAAEQGRLLLNA